MNHLSIIQRLGTWLVVLLLLGSTLPAASVNAAPTAAAQSGGADLSNYLAPDGSLRLPAGFNGSLDPSGYHLELGSGGAPHFIPGPATPNAPDAPDALSTPGVENWAGDFAQIGANSTVSAIAVSGTDIYIGGQFTYIAGILSPRVARWDGTAWRAMGFGLNGAVNALIIDSGGDLYAGGAFTGAFTNSTYVTITPTNRIARWNGTAWDEVGYGLTGTVNALAVTTGVLYAGGSFTSYYTNSGHTTSASAYRVAQWNGTAWSEVGYGLNGTVNALAFATGTLYAGGAFTAYYTDGTHTPTAPAHYAANWNSTTWSELGYGLNAAVNALAILGGNLYAGGGFTDAYTDATYTPTTTARYIALFSGGVWSEVGYGIASSINALAVSGSTLYAGGNFTTYYTNSGHTTTAAANRIASWNGAAWSEVGYGFDGIVNALALNGTDLLAGGQFTGAYTSSGHNSLSAALRISSYNGSSWVNFASGAGLNGLNGSIACLLADGTGSLYAGGSFTFAGSLYTPFIAKWNGTAWSEVGYGLNGTVNALAFDGSGNLYAGGSFTGYYTNSGHTTTAAANRIAKFSGGVWSEVGYGIAGTVNALAFDSNGTLYAGGSFTTYYTDSGHTTTAAANRIAQFSGGVWSEAGYGFGGAVAALVTSGSTLYAGGSFTTYYTDSGHSITAAANHIAQFSGGVWSEVGYGLDNTVNALAFDSAANLHAGGSFTTSYTDSGHSLTAAANRIAKFSGGVWSEVGYGLSGTVSALAFDSGGNLYAAGSFTTYYTDSGHSITAAANSVALWNGTTWKDLTGGLPASTTALAPRGGYLYLGGSSTSAGSPAKHSGYIARWTALETRPVSGTGSYSFYADTYPVTISVTTQGTLAVINMHRSDTNHPSNSGGHGYYWQIEGLDAGGAAASGYTLTLTFTTPGFSPGADTKICKFLNPGWQCLVTSYTASTVTLANVTSLSQWLVGNLSTTAVNVTNYTALPQRNGVKLSWQTPSEANTLGFNLYRSQPAQGGGFVRLNAALIPAQSPDSTDGNTYQYVDASALPGVKYTYKLEHIAPDQSANAYLLEGGYYLIHLPWLSK